MNVREMVPYGHGRVRPDTIKINHGVAQNDLQKALEAINCNLGKVDGQDGAIDEIVRKAFSKERKDKPDIYNDEYLEKVIKLAKKWRREFGTIKLSN